MCNYIVYGIVEIHRSSFMIVMMTMLKFGIFCKHGLAIDKKMSDHRNAMRFMLVGMKWGILSSCAWEWASKWVFLEDGEGGEIVFMVIAKWWGWRVVMCENNLNRKYTHIYILISCSRVQRVWPTILKRRESLWLSFSRTIVLEES